MVSMTSVGRPAGHIEGPSKVTGSARYSADITLQGMLWGKSLRSPLAHARILSIDTSRARELPGVYAVLTAADIPETMIGHRILDIPVLARDKVRFIGEKVAAVAADSPEIAEEALQLIDVQYEELPGVFEAGEAMQDNAPRVHDAPPSYPDAPENPPPIPNLISQVFYRHGDVEAGFAQAERVFEHTYYVPGVHHGYIEPHACVVQVEDDGKVNVWLSNKAPFRTRGEIAAAIGVPADDVCINPVAIGGDFGGKGSVMDSVLSYFLAKRTGRPIKMVMTYTEELMAANPRHETTITLRTGVDKDGTMVARRATIVFNAGAYGGMTPGFTIHGAIDAGGPYRLPNIEIEALRIYTNRVPGGHMRAPGGPQVVFAVESHMDMIAHELGVDPLEYRLRHVIEEGDETPMGHRFRDMRGRETLLAAAEASGWNQPKQPNTGRGLSFYDRPPGGGASTVQVSVDAGGRITLLSTLPDTGTGSLTILQQIVAEELQAPLASVTIVTGDTDSAPNDGGVGGSRVTHAAGQAASAGAREMRQALTELAARHWGVEPEQVELLGGRYAARDGRSMDLKELLARAGTLETLPIVREGSYKPSGHNDVTSFCAQVAEVSVDPDTGKVTLKRFTTVHDVGTVINPLTHQGQIEGGFVMGMGQALIEHLRVEDGAVTEVNLGDYKLPGSRDIPELQTILLESKAGPAPFEGKSIGETSNCPVMAAVANAVFDAVGLRITDLPITAEKVYTRMGAER